MVKITISENQTKCRKCKYHTFKIEHHKGPDKNLFYLTRNQLMCAGCGYIYDGELNETKKKELEVSEEDYNKMLRQHQEFKSNKKENGF